MEREETEVSREQAALEQTAQQYKELFGEEMPIGPFMAVVYQVLNEKWAKFAKTRLDHLSIFELQNLIGHLNGSFLEPISDSGHPVEGIPSIQVARAKKNAKKKES